MLRRAMPEFKPVMPHGELEEVFPGIHFVTGTTRPRFMDMDWQFSRSMTVVRDGDSLTLVNTVRLDDAGLATLDSLGKVEHIVKLGAFHGMDDAFYKDRYGAQQWGLAGMTHEGGHETDDELRPGGPTPFGGCSVFVFETAKEPEGLLLLEREGGILISCDSLQNWAEADQYFDDSTTQRMTGAGFIKPTNIGPGWLGSAEPDASDFKRLQELSYRHLLPAHGTPVRDEAHARFGETFARQFEL